MSGSNDQQPQQPVDQNALLQAWIQQQFAAASGQGQQVQLPSLPAPQAQTQYSNDPSKGPDLLERIGLALGGGSLPGAPAELRAQMGRQGLLNFGIGLMSAGKFATPGEVFAGGLRGAQQGLLGSEAAQAGQQEYALNAQGKLLGLGIEQQKARTEALQQLVPLLQMQGRLGLPPLFGGGAGPGGPGGGSPGGGIGAPDSSIDIGDKSDFIDKFTPIAQQISAKTGLPVNYVIGQAGLETGWGTSAAAKNNNFFGISGPDGKPLSYKTPQAGIDAYTALMASDRYKNVARTGSPQQIGDAMAVAGYNPNVPRQGSTDSYGARVGAFAGSIPTRTAQGGGGGGGPAPAPVGPYKPPGAAPAAAGPPGSTDDSWFPSATPAPPAGGGGQLSIGDVALPPAKGSAANVVPGLSAADATAIAKRTGQDVPFGDQGMVAHPSGRVGTAGGGGFGKRADAGQVGQDVAAIQGGMQGGGAAPDATVQAAGPAAGGPPGIGSALAPPTPGLATSIGPVGPITTPQPPAPPAAQPQPPAQPPQVQPQPPARAPDLTARNDDGTYVVPNDKLSLPDYQQRFRHVPTADELTQRGLVIPGNEAEAQAAARGVQEAETAAQVAQTAANRAQAGYTGYGTVADLLKANTEAQAKAQAAREKYADMLQDTTKTNAAALQKYYDKQDSDLATNYKAEVLDPRNKAAEINLQGEQAIRLKQAEIGTLAKQKLIDEANADVKSSHDSVTQLEALRDISHAAGAPDLTAASPELRDWLGRIGALSPEASAKAAAQTTLEAANNRLISVLRNGTGFQRTTNMDLQFLQRSGPGGPWTPEEYRDSVSGFLLDAFRHQQQYSARLAAYLGEGKSYADAVDQADKDVGPVIKQVPQTFEGQPLNTKLSQDQWAWDNGESGQFMKSQDGKRLIRVPDKTKYQRPQ